MHIGGATTFYYKKNNNFIYQRKITLTTNMKEGKCISVIANNLAL
jgi:hypothetical protein